MPVTNKKISELTAATVVELDYILPVVNPADLTETFKSSKELFKRGTVTTLSANTTLSAIHEIVKGDTTAASLTFTLPDATTCVGRGYLIQKIASANSLIIDTTASQTINGSLTQTLTTLNGFLTLYSDGTNWIAQIASTTTTLTGEVTGSGSGSFATTMSNAAVIAKVLTGFSSAAGTVAATDSILQAVNKLDGNIALKAPLASPTFTGTVAGVTALKNATTEVSTGAAAAPTSGQVLTATSSTTATWQTPSGGGRADAKLNLTATTINAASGVIDIVTAEVVIITLDVALTSNITFSTTPADGTKLIIKYKKGATPQTATLDTAKFQDSSSSIHPSPMLLAAANTEDTFNYLYSSDKGKMSLTGFDLGA